MITNHEIHNKHLMDTMANIIIGATGITDLVVHSNTITVTGNGVRDALKTIVDQVPVQNMRVYKVDPKNLRTNKDIDVHVVWFTSILLVELERMTGHM